MRFITTLVSSALLFVLAHAQTNATSTAVVASSTVSLTPAQSSEAACLAACKHIIISFIFAASSNRYRPCNRSKLQSEVHPHRGWRYRPAERHNRLYLCLPSRKWHSGRKSSLRKLPEGLSSLRHDHHSSIYRLRDWRSSYWFRLWCRSYNWQCSDNWSKWK